MSSITDVAGIRVAHIHRIGDGWLTGVTIVVPPEGTLGGVDIRGAAPAAHQTAALHTGALAPQPQAIVLTGGSSYGLIAAQGAHRWFAEHNQGYRVGPEPHQVVPLVPAAAIYDLGRGGDFGATPTEQMGYEAAARATASPLGADVERGTVGAGTGAAVFDESFKGGVGTASVRVRLSDGVVATVGALAVVNAFGAVAGSPDDSRAGVRDDRSHPGFPPFNTTLVVVATDAGLDLGTLHQTAVTAHDGIARAIDPVHTLADGDAVFALSTGAVQVPGTQQRLVDSREWRDNIIGLQAVAARAVRAAIIDGLRSATPVTTPALDLPRYPGL